MSDEKMSPEIHRAAEKYKNGMDRAYALLGLCSTDEQVDDVFAEEKKVEEDFLVAYWQETRSINQLEDCMRSNARKIYKLVTGVGYVPAD